MNSLDFQIADGLLVVFNPKFEPPARWSRIRASGRLGNVKQEIRTLAVCPWDLARPGNLQ